MRSGRNVYHAISTVLALGSYAQEQMWSTGAYVDLCNMRENGSEG